MYLEEDLLSQLSGVGKCFTQTAPKSSLRGKTLSENHSSTVDSATTMSEITGTSAPKMAHGVLIHQMILILTKAIRINSNPGYYSKSAPATVLNSFRFINSTSHYCFYSTLIRKARGQVTVTSLFTAIMTNHCSSRWK